MKHDAIAQLVVLKYKSEFDVEIAPTCSFLRGSLPRYKLSC
jgi:hypothetical protein